MARGLPAHIPDQEALRRLLFDSLDNAVASGYEHDIDGLGTSMHDSSDEAVAIIAADTTECDADLEGVAHEVLIPLIREWQIARRQK